MQIRRLVPGVVALLLVAGCAGPADDGPTTPVTPDAEAAGTASDLDEAAAQEPEAPEADAVRTQLPALGCDEIAGLLAPFADGLVEDPVAPHVTTAEEISCGWTSPEPVEMTDIRSLTVQIMLADDEVPDPAEAAAFGMDLYVSDPRLDALGGVAIWIPATEEGIIGGGVGTVLVPGLDISVANGAFGKETGFSLEDVITFALAVV